MEKIEKTSTEVDNKLPEIELSDANNEAQEKDNKVTEPESQHKKDEVQLELKDSQMPSDKEVEMAYFDKKVANEPPDESLVGQASETVQSAELNLNEKKKVQVMNTEASLLSNIEIENRPLSQSEEEILVNKETKDNPTTIPIDQAPSMNETEPMIQEKKTDNKQEDQTNNIVVEPMNPIEIDSGVVDTKVDSKSEDEIKEKTTNGPIQKELGSIESKLVVETKTPSLSAIVTSEATAEMGPIDDKSEGIFLETTNETINLESAQEDDEKDISTIEKENAEEDTDTVSNEITENLATDENVAIANTETSVKAEPAQTTPKVQKKKAKTSTPNKHSINDVHASQKRRKKDPAAPKAPLNGYLVYFNDERAEMRMKHPNMGFGELTKIIAVKWKDLPAEEKQKFITEADMDKERYVKEMAEYKKSESYKNYVKETSQAKMARNEHMLNNSHPQDDINSFTIANESNIAGFDIPIFSEEFIEHSKSRENEMRLVRKEISELEQQNSVLHKHIEIMKQSSVKLDTDIENFQNTNNQLKKKMDAFRQTVINCNIQLPNSMEFPNPNNIDDYIMRLYHYVSSNQNPNDVPFVNHVKGVLSKINFTSLFE